MTPLQLVVWALAIGTAFVALCIAISFGIWVIYDVIRPWFKG